MLRKAFVIIGEGVRRSAEFMGDHVTAPYRHETYQARTGLDAMIVKRRVMENGRATRKVIWTIKPLDHSFVASSDL